MALSVSACQENRKKASTSSSAATKTATEGIATPHIPTPKFDQTRYDQVIYLISPDGTQQNALVARDGEFRATYGGVEGTGAHQAGLTPFSVSLDWDATGDEVTAQNALAAIKATAVNDQDAFCVQTASEIVVRTDDNSSVDFSFDIKQKHNLNTATSCTYQVTYKNLNLFKFHVLFNYTLKDWLTTPETPANSTAKRTAQLLAQTPKDTNFIYIDNKQISDISALSGYVSATKLNLSNNNLTTLNPEIFSNLENLTELNLSNNQLAQIDADLFDYLGGLDTLNLAQNRLTKIDDLTFEHLYNLSYLNISGNPFTNLPEGLFDSQSNQAVIIKDTLPTYWTRRILYSTLQTNLSETRWFQSRTMRARVVRHDGSEPILLGRNLLDKLTGQAADNTATQSGAWSADGKFMTMSTLWQSDANWQAEKARNDFVMTPEGYRLDGHIVSVDTPLDSVNVTADSPSNYNAALSFAPVMEGQKPRLIFQAIQGQIGTLFIMDLDGKNKTTAIPDQVGYTYGLNMSSSKEKMAYHTEYQVYIANKDGSGAQHLNTGNKFNFGPIWSPDGTKLIFLSKPDYNQPASYLYSANYDGSELKAIASLNNYDQQYYLFDRPVFHSGATDLPSWGPDSKTVYYTARVGDNTEIFSASFDGSAYTQISHSPRGSDNYWPRVSQDGRFLVFGGKRPDGTRQLYVKDLRDLEEPRPITNLPAGFAALLPAWQPLP